MTFYHTFPVKFLGVGEMGWWFQHTHRQERFLVPSAGKPVSTCVGSKPINQACNLCGFQPLVYKCGDTCRGYITKGGCA